MQLQTTQNFWSGKRVFITGHTGFKGGWLSLWLNSLGAEVSGYSLEAPSTPSFHGVTELDSHVHSIEGDIRDLEKLSAAMQNARPDIVMHLAAQSLVRKSYAEPVETFDVNVMGTVKVLEAIRSIDSVKAAVIVTSDKCYENREWHWGYRETESMGGYDTYSASKGCTELATHSYIQAFFSGENAHHCAIATARAGNVIGGGDWAEDRLMPDILKNLSDKEAVEIRSPNAIRPWQHVLEPLSGYMNLAQHLFESGKQFSGGWNFGPNDDGAKTVSWIADVMVEKWGSGSWFLSEQVHPHEATYLKLDSSKARAELSWSPVWNPAEAITTTIRWHKCWLDNKCMATESLRDIEQYTSDRKALYDV